MANEKISAMGTVASLTATDAIPLAKSGSNYRTNPNQITQYVLTVGHTPLDAPAGSLAEGTGITLQPGSSDGTVAFAAGLFLKGSNAAPGSSNIAGRVQIMGGISTLGQGGYILAYGGVSYGAGKGGTVKFRGGDSALGRGGDVVLIPGVGATRAGDIISYGSPPYPGVDGGNINFVSSYVGGGGVPGTFTFGAAYGGPGSNGGTVHIYGGSSNDQMAGDVILNPGVGTDALHDGATQIGGNPSVICFTHRWLAGQSPSNVALVTSARRMKITAIIVRPEIVNGAAATLTVAKAASGTAISSGTVLTTNTANLATGANTNQTLTLISTSDLGLDAGDTIGIVTTGTFAASAGSVTVWATMR